MSTIIVGVDLSPSSDIAIGHAIDLARADRGELLLVLVDAVPDVPEGVEATLEGHGARVDERLAVHARELETLRTRWSGRGVEITHRVVGGHPDEALPKIAGELGADAIVLGSHGKTGLKRVLLGSVAERVVRLAPCAVMVARGEAPIGGYHRLVVGTDFGETSQLALDRALVVAAPRARIDIVHCWQMSPMLAPPDAPAMIPTYENLRTDMAAKLQHDGAALAERASQGRDLEVRFHLLERPTAHGIDDFALDVHADLIVIGSHGRRGMRRFLLGSIAEVTVRHAPCATLVVRGAEPAT
jgi:nucleotide-binding universal stress UspA family protein